MKIRILTAFITCTLTCILWGQEITDHSYISGDERIVVQKFKVKASKEDTWKVFTTEDGLKSWFAPVVEVDWKRGGTVKSRYKVGGIIGERNTVTTIIVDYIPMKRITMKDDLAFLLSYGMSQKWINDVSDSFMFELIADGSDLFTTVEFQESGDQTEVTITMTGYKVGEEWDKRFKSTLSSNDWTYKKLIQRFDEGPVDWAKVN